MSNISKSANQAFSWLFKDKAGKIAIIQWPNISFALWLSLKAFLKLFPDYSHQIFISQIASVVLIYWALLEVTKGDSKFRKLLGLLILTLTILGLIKSFT